jgi:hypothetical protein
MARGIRHRHAPSERGARDRQVLESGLDEAHYLIAARVRQNEIGIRFIEGEQLFAIGGKLEEERFLFGPFDRCSLRALSKK